MNYTQIYLQLIKSSIKRNLLSFFILKIVLHLLEEKYLMSLQFYILVNYFMANGKICFSGVEME